jgi:inorganic triphosphatase YgiF
MVVLEVEAKFTIPDEKTFQQLLHTAELAGFSLGEGALVRLHDLYLDTMDGDIRAEGFACRLRREETHYLATVKGLGGVSGAVHRRVEHEVPLSEPLPPWDWPSSTARDVVLPLLENEAITLLFEIEQSRHSRSLFQAERTVASLNLDRVCICPREPYRKADTYLELEVEMLPGGSEADLDSLVVALESEWGLTPQVRSKFQRGLALCGPGRARRWKAE